MANFENLPLFVSYLACFEVTENTYINRILCDIFFEFTPTEIEHFVWEWPF